MTTPALLEEGNLWAQLDDLLTMIEFFNASFPIVLYRRKFWDFRNNAESAARNLKDYPAKVFTGDVSPQWTVATLTDDGNWNDLDITTVTGYVGKFNVGMNLTASDNNINKFFGVRTNGFTNGTHVISTRTDNEDQSHNNNGQIMTDSSGIIEYNGSATVFTKIDIAIQWMESIR